MKIESIIKEIETTKDVKNIKSHGVHVWLDIRSRFFYKLSIGKETNLVINSGLYWMILKSFFYGFKNWFLKFDYWFFGTNLNRIKINDKYYDRLFDYPAQKLGKSLLIEYPSKKHAKQKEVETKHIISKAPLIVAEKILERFLSKRAEGINVFNEIKAQYNLKIDPSYSIGKMVAQYKMMRFLLRFKKPKTVFISPAYTNMGYLKAFKEQGIKVIEVQHGVINKEHFGYNFYANYPRTYFPDALLTFGSFEKKVFDEENVFINPENVFPVGSFYIDHLGRNFVENEEVENWKQNFKRTCAVALQDCDIGMKLIPFLIEVAEKNSNVLFLVKRRRTELTYYLDNFIFPENIKFMNEIDVYQIILHADFHLTAYSTTALEAPALGKSNLLINIDNKAIEYYQKTLVDNQVTHYLETVEQVSEQLKVPEVLPDEIIKEKHAEVIQNDYKARMDEFLASL